MIYRNERTGTLIETSAVISGGGWWQEVSPAALAAHETPAQKPETRGKAGKLKKAPAGAAGKAGK